MPASSIVRLPLRRLHGAHEVDDVLPDRLAASASRHHVVQGQLAALRAAVLALQLSRAKSARREIFRCTDLGTRT